MGDAELTTLHRWHYASSIKAATALLFAAMGVVQIVHAQSSDPFVDVKAFGASGDGSRDDTVAIQKALTFAASLKTRPEVFFPAGTYIISQTLTIASPMRLVGTSADIFGGSSILTTSATDDVIFLDSGAAGSAIEGLSIRSRQPAQTSGAGIRVNFSTSKNGTGMTPLRIENVFVSNTYDGIWIQAANNVYLSDLFIVGLGHDGLRLGHTGTGTVGVNLRSSMLAAAANADIDIINSAGIQMNNVQTYHGGHSVVIAKSAQFFLQGVVADSTTGDAFLVSGSNDLNFVNCWAAGSASGHGVSLLNVNNFSWVGGFIRENYGSGIVVNSGVSNLSVNSVSFSSNGLNNPTGSDTYGIYVNKPVTNLRVLNNVFGDVGEDAGVVRQTYALYFSTGASDASNPAVIQGNQDFHDTFTNSHIIPWIVAGNEGQPSWTVGSTVPTQPCNNGSLYSALANGGTLYVCRNTAWHAVSLSN